MESGLDRDTVQSGDTLQSIAYQLWGDSSLWYKLAEVNGLQSDSTLVEGQLLIVPAGVQRNEHNATTYKPYDPLEVLGNTSPTSPKPAKAKCGAFGQVILAAIAVVVSMYAGPVVGSIVSQGVGLATGIQEKFSWNAVGMAWVASFIGGPIGRFAGGVAGSLGASAASQAVVSAVVANAVSQGIGVATGMQKKFSWASVAGAGVSAGLGPAVNRAFGAQPLSGQHAVLTASNIMRNVGAATAMTVVHAATQSLIEGSDFGDNIQAALPHVIGQTIGQAIAGGMSGRGSATTGSAKVGSTPKNAEEVIQAECEGNWQSAFDFYSREPATKTLGDKQRWMDPILVEEEEVVVTATRRPWLLRMAINAVTAVADFVGADGQVFYDGYSHDRTFSLGNTARAWSDVSSFVNEYNPIFNLYFNLRGDAGRTYGAIGAAILDIGPSIGRGFDHFLNGDLVGVESAEYWAHGIREPQPPPPSLLDVYAEFTGIPGISRARDEFQSVERLSRRGDRAGAIEHAKAFLWEGGNVVIAATGYRTGARAIIEEVSAARVADAAALRHAAWASDLDQVSATVERLGQRALRNSGNNWQTSERLFEGYLEGVNGRLVQSGSDFTIAIQPAAKGGERVTAFVARGQRVFPNPGSVRLDAGITTMALPTNQIGLRPVVAGFDITLNRSKPNIVTKYREHFGPIPIYDIRLP